jgi:DNA-binding transcriptional LysR family regulator
MSDRLQQIVLFVEVARQTSFVRAAERLHVNVSAASRAVAALEQRLGVRLFQRSTRRVALTEAGRAHFARCEALLHELDDAEASVSQLSGTIQGILRVSVPSGLGITDIVPALPEFLANHPQLNVDLHLTNRMVDLVEESFDLAIRVGGLLDSRLVVRRLGASRRLLVASREYLQRAGQPRTPQALEQHDALTLDVGVAPQRWILRRGSDEVAVTPTARVRSGNALALHQLALGGCGISLLPGFVVGADLDAARLQRVLPRWSSPEQIIHAVYPANRFIPAKVRAFVEYLQVRLRTVR